MSGEECRERVHCVGIDDVEYGQLDVRPRPERAGSAGGRLGPPLVPTDQPHGGTEPRQLERGRPADPRRGARHDDDAPVRSDGGRQCSRRPRTPEPARLKLPTTLASSALSTARGRGTPASRQGAAQPGRRPVCHAGERPGDEGRRQAQHATPVEHRHVAHPGARTRPLHRDGVRRDDPARRAWRTTRRGRSISTTR